MRILLVNLPRDWRETMFPLELASMAAVLGVQGYQVEGFDFGVQPESSWPEVAEAFDVVLLMVCQDTWNRTRQLLGQLEADDRRLIVTMGPYATLHPDQLLANAAVDVTVLGEGERVIVRVIRSWQSGSSAPIPGAVWHQRWSEKGFISSREFHRVEQLDKLPVPDRTVFRADDYTGMATRRRRYTQIVATRGCCRTDAQSALARLLPGGRRARPVGHVIEEMAMLRERFGIREFHFEDDALFEDPDYVGDLHRQIRGRLPGVLWQCPNGNHPDDLAVEMLEGLAAAGCYRIYLQLDSPNPDAMRLLRRWWDPTRLGPLTATARRVGLELGGYFTLGLPDETPKQMRQTVRFAVRSGLRWAQFTPFRFTAGSELYDQREALSARLPAEPLVRQVIRKAYWRFYGSKCRWATVLRNLHGRNARQLLSRSCSKLLRGQT